MPRPAGSFLTILFGYITLKVPPGGIGGNLTSRNLNTYYEAKKNANNMTSGHADRKSVKDMADRAAVACGFHHSHAPYVLGNARQDAAAATVLALSIIKDTGQQDLTGNYQRLCNQNERQSLKELNALLQQGDLEQSKMNHRLTLKNFTSAGNQKKRYLLDAEDAYNRAYRLLTNSRKNFILQNGPLSPKISQNFALYFGNPNTMVTVALIPWDNGGAAAPNFAALQVPARVVVQEVLRKICNVFLTQETVRLYFGGKSIDPGTYAYVSGVTNPAKIHLGGTFFRANKDGIDTQGGTIVHELTHTFADTDDHDYGEPGCRALAVGNALENLQALSNADNYQYFIEKGFLN